MKIGIIVAMDKELRQLQSLFTDGQVKVIRRDGSSVPASRYAPLFILSPGDCAVFEE